MGDTVASVSSVLLMLDLRGNDQQGVSMQFIADKKTYGGIVMKNGNY